MGYLIAIDLHLEVGMVWPHTLKTPLQAWIAHVVVNLLMKLGEGQWSWRFLLEVKLIGVKVCVSEQNSSYLDILSLDGQGEDCDIKIVT